MNQNRKEEIIMATLKLASNKGLGAVSMNMIAESIGIRKPSLYNHFKSKEELVEQMYIFLRENAQKNTNSHMDYSIFENKNAYNILSTLVKNYIMLCCEKNMQTFYKVIYSERAFSKEASKIMATETNKMINATKQIFDILQSNKLLKFNNLEVSAMSFALTIHSLIDYLNDSNFGEDYDFLTNSKLINDFIKNFCEEHVYGE